MPPLCRGRFLRRNVERFDLRAQATPRRVLGQPRVRALGGSAVSLVRAGPAIQVAAGHARRV